MTFNSEKRYLNAGRTTILDFEISKEKEDYREFTEVKEPRIIKLMDFSYSVEYGSNLNKKLLKCS